MERSSAAEQLILRLDAAPDALFDGSHPAEAERYLRAVEDLLRCDPSTSSNARALHLAMAKLEAEFRNILLARVPDFDADLLLSDIGSLSLTESVDDFDGGGGESSRRQGSRDFDGEESSEEEQRGMSRLRSGTQSGRSMNSLVEIDLVPSDVLYDLQMVAEKMISAGYGKECFQVYGSVRKGAVESCLRHLRLEELSNGDGDIHRLPWEAVEANIPRWIRASKACFRLVFASERRLCDLVFGGLDGRGVSSGASSDVAFAESVVPVASLLLDFAETIGREGRTLERLFNIADLHDALRDLMPNIESVFFGPSSSIQRQAEEILSMLVDAVEEIFAVFESLIRSQSSKSPVRGGAIHPMTRYVMNYIGMICDYKASLSNIIGSKPSAAAAPGSNSSSQEMEFPADEEDRSRPLSSHVLHLMASLASNLEGTAKLYKDDDALSHLFLMNNLHYIVHKVKDSPELRELIGDDYPRRLKSQYRMAAMMYQREAWGNIINLIHGSGCLSQSALRERLRSFNAAFEESQRRQSGWVVPDGELKEEMRILISERLLPAYRSFLSSHKMLILKEKHPESYAKYTVEDLEKAIGNFFDGAPPPQPSRMRSVSDRLLRHPARHLNHPH